jgi:MFS family permease
MFYHPRDRTPHPDVLRVFFKSSLSEFGWTRASLSGAASVAFLFLGALGILVGGLTDRIGPRLIMTATGGLLGLGYLLMSQTGSLWRFYFFYGVVVGTGMSAIDVVPLTIKTRWFARRGGLMTGIVKVGTGAGQMTIPLTASLLIAGYGWRSAYLIMGGLVFVLLIAISQVLRRDPGQRELTVDGAGAVQIGRRDQDKGLGLREAAGTKQFWFLCMANFSVIYCLLTIMMHIVPHAMDSGISSIKAAGILSTIGGVSMLGRITTGFAIDRIGSKRSMIICFVILITSFLWLQVAEELWILTSFLKPAIKPT